MDGAPWIRRVFLLAGVFFTVGGPIDTASGRFFAWISPRFREP